MSQTENEARQSKKDSEIKSLLNLIKSSDNKTIMKVIGIEKEFTVIKNNDLYKTFDAISDSKIRIYAHRLGYDAKQTCEGWCFEIKKEEEKPTKEDNKLEEEISRLEEMSSHRLLSSKDLCRLLNLRKIYNIRKGDNESLLLDDFANEYTKVCRISKYEEIRLGFKLMETATMGKQGEALSGKCHLDWKN